MFILNFSIDYNNANQGDIYEQRDVAKNRDYLNGNGERKKNPTHLV